MPVKDLTFSSIDSDIFFTIFGFAFFVGFVFLGFSFFCGSFFERSFFISSLGWLESSCEIFFLASNIVCLINSQYKLIALLASSLPGIGKFIPVGSEFVSTIATIGIFNLIDSLTA